MIHLFSVHEYGNGFVGLRRSGVIFPTLQTEESLIDLVVPHVDIRCEPEKCVCLINDHTLNVLEIISSGSTVTICEGSGGARNIFPFQIPTVAV